MNLSQINTILGKKISDPALESEFKKLGIDLSESVQLNEGDYRTYLELPDKGICYVFTDEAFYLGKDDQVIGLGPLYLSSVFFYSEGKDGYSQYQGSLPKDMSFNDDQLAIESKLGKSDWTKELESQTIVAERWNVDGYSVHVTYNRDARKVDIISYQKTDQMR